MPLLCWFLLFAPADNPNDFLGPAIVTPDGRTVTAAVRYWDELVGVPFTRDATVEIPPTPLDLDLNRTPDTAFSGRWDLPGGILGNPARVGLVATPDDPAGTVGKDSVSTGFLGVREELDEQTGRGTGRHGFNCWLCHANADGGRVVFGRPNTQVDLGLIVAAARVLDEGAVLRDPPGGAPIAEADLVKREGFDSTFRFDADGDGRITIAEWRAALRLPPAREMQAQLLLAGPGRLDQSIDHRMDGFIPLANLQHHDLNTYGRERYLRRARQPKRSVFNPVSIPTNRIGLGVAHYSWSAKDSAMRVDTLGILHERLQMTPLAAADLLHFSHGAEVDQELLQRALTLDFRNVATLGREIDDDRAVGWPDRVLTKPELKDLADSLERYYAVPTRELLLRKVADAPETPEIAAGRRIFLERACGTVKNQRVVFGREARVPEKYRGIAALVPVDRSRPQEAQIEVRCASCHNFSPTSAWQPLAPADAAGFQRCDLCHFDHPMPERPGEFRGVDEHSRALNLAGPADCVSCHVQHPAFGRQVYSNSWVLPFDANGNGLTHGDETADAAAGGIGTDAHLNLDTTFEVQLRPAEARPQAMYLVSDDHRRVPARVVASRAGSGWVRVAPLTDAGFSAPYLHNGSVPTLEALLEPAARRPAKFPVGTPEQRFVYDTALPGNHNGGHTFGIDFTPEEKRAVVAYLRSLGAGPDSGER